MSDVSADVDSRSLGIGALSGVLAYIAGYVIVFVWQGPSVEQRLEEVNALLGIAGVFADVDQVSKVDAIGWLFYNAHWVRTQTGGSETVNYIAEADGGELLYAVPIVLLLLAGLLAVFLVGVDTLQDGAITGGSVTLGYLPLAIVGAFFFTYEIGDNVIKPELLTAVVLAGVFYPLVVGAVGGVAGVFLSERI